MAPHATDPHQTKNQRAPVTLHQVTRLRDQTKNPHLQESFLPGERAGLAHDTARRKSSQGHDKTKVISHDLGLYTYDCIIDASSVEQQL